MLSVINEDYWIPNEAGKLVVIQSKQLEPQSNIPASLISLPQPPAILPQKSVYFYGQLATPYTTQNISRNI